MQSTYRQLWRILMCIYILKTFNRLWLLAIHIICTSSTDLFNLHTPRNYEYQRVLQLKLDRLCIHALHIICTPRADKSTEIQVQINYIKINQNQSNINVYNNINIWDLLTWITHKQFIFSIILRNRITLFGTVHTLVTRG